MFWIGFGTQVLIWGSWVYSLFLVENTIDTATDLNVHSDKVFYKSLIHGSSCIAMHNMFTAIMFILASDEIYEGSLLVIKFCCITLPIFYLGWLYLKWRKVSGNKGNLTL